MATFILVHGTFAKSANWLTLQAGLAEAACAVGETPSFEQLTWSGKNRANARQAAASAILALVQKIRSTSRNEKIFVIGHSHGGSTVAYFLKQYPDVAETLGGCAFLSTPFVAIRPRTKVLQRIFVLIYLPICAAIMLLSQIIWPPDLLPPITLNILEVAMKQLALWGPAGAFFALILWYFYKASKPDKLMEQSIRQQTTNIPDGNYLFLRYSGDEAAAALSAVQFIAWLGIKVSKLLELLTRPMFSSRSIPQFVSTSLVIAIVYCIVFVGWFNVIPAAL
jgi:pimeloyl-ACP methyl ester carboxylesterase